MPNILYWDIENSYKLAAVFDTWNVNIPHGNVYQDTFIISAQWKWEGGEVQSITSKGKDDTRVVKKLHSLLSSADYAVAHNGDRHDYPILLAKVIEKRLNPIKEPVFIDTLKMARKLKVVSRSLAHLSEKFQLPLKRETRRELWLDASIKGCQRAINEICEYGEGDIDNLEQLFNLLKTYVPNKMNMGLYADRPCCPSCGGERMIVAKHRPAGRFMRTQWQCQDCGKYTTTGQSEKRAFFK